jgi:hypothetical protein
MRLRLLITIGMVWPAALPAAPPVAAGAPVALSLTLRDHRFVPAELHAPAGRPIVLTLDNQDDTPEEFESHDLRKEQGGRGHARIVIRIKPQEPGRYRFVGEFHQATAKGVLIIQ